MDKHNIAAIYVRVSTTKESQKDSPEHQKSLCEEYLKELGLELACPPYEDRDTGTSIVARPQIQNMIRDAQKGLFDTILFSSLSRFSRDALDSISLKRMFVNALGIRLISIEDLYDSAKDDNEMLFSMVSVVNQKLSEQLSISSRRGIRQSALKGNYIGSIAPYGYKKALIDGRKTLLIDEEKAKIVEMIFDLYVNQKMGEKLIVNYLNGQNETGEIYLSYKGGLWGLSSVQRMLQNEVYTGENVFSKHEIKKVYDNITNMTDRRRKLVKKSDDSWLKTGFKTHEAIISDELFMKAQEVRLIRGGGKRGGRKQFVNVFAKMIFCKHCGSAVVCMSSKQSKEGVKYRYLMCSKRRRQGEKGCSNGKWLPYYEVRDEIIKGIITRLSKLVETDTEKLVIKTNEKDYQKEINKVKKEIENSRKLLFEIRKQKMLEEIDQQQYEFEKKEYEQSILENEKKLVDLEIKQEDRIDLSKLRVEIKQAIQELLKLENYDDVDKARMILMKLIKQILVDEEGNIEVHTPLGQL